MTSNERSWPFAPALVKKPEHVRTAIEFHVAVANLIRRAVEEGEGQRTGLLYRRTVIRTHLGKYTVNGNGTAQFPIKDVDLDKLPKPLWNFFNGYFERGEPLTITVRSSGEANFSSVLTITDLTKLAPPKIIQVVADGPSLLEFFKAQKKLQFEDNEQTIIQIARQMVDLAFDVVDKSKVSQLR